MIKIFKKSRAKFPLAHHNSNRGKWKYFKSFDFYHPKHLNIQDLIILQTRRVGAFKPTLGIFLRYINNNMENTLSSLKPRF